MMLVASSFVSGFHAPVSNNYKSSSSSTTLRADPVAINSAYAAPFVLALLPLFIGNNNPFADTKVENRVEATSSKAETPSSVDLSIPYDAAARNAFDADENSGDDFEAFKAKFEKEAIDLVTSKQAARASAKK
eukprot:CAMPEP_0194142870 /NCGR_PEP_ID=MMETSP0152-20130528/12074_1 /TAXON_ID=1049557 /ORGANISM="Thalassiothrix antarctica, Strain L6-D1" /LENGTH=132 /DNA_ID=CAMNT_0038841987 /DNA_START=92 /DNA_END=490 /DNA_ORIENTATION=-